MSNWTKVKSAPGVQTWEKPVHPESVVQIKSDDTQEMLRHAEQQLELQRQYPARKRNYPSK